MIKTLKDIKLFNTKEITEIKELKKEYKRLAFIHHPDSKTGNLETMKQVNNEYDYLLQHISLLTQKTCKPDLNNCYDAEFKRIIESLIKLNLKNITIEVVGFFIYINGITKDMTTERQLLKSISWTAKNGKPVKFRYNSKQKNWYYSPSWYIRRGKKTYSMEQKRTMYGSDTYNTTDKQAPKNVELA